MYLSLPFHDVPVPPRLMQQWVPSQQQTSHWEDLSLLEDPQCLLDPHTHAPAQSPSREGGNNRVLRGWLHVLLHPVYQVKTRSVCALCVPLSSSRHT